MGKRGPAPTPKKLHDLRGNPSKRSKQETEPTAPAGWPDCPKTVQADPVALAEWQSTCRHLEAIGILATTDKMILELFAVTYSKWLIAHQHVVANGDVLELGDNKYPTMSPWSNQEQRYSTMLYKLLCELGLAPGSRARQRGPGQSDAANKWKGVIKFAS